jgi:hypothetical protein
MGAPVNDSAAHNFCCSVMIAKKWRYYSEIKSEYKWAFAGSFNVMQHFFYNSSQSFVDKSSKDRGVAYLGYLKNIFDKVIPKLLEFNAPLK